MQFKSLFSQLHRKKNDGQKIEADEPKEKPSKRRKSVPKDAKSVPKKSQKPKKEELLTETDWEELQEDIDEFDSQIENQELKEIRAIFARNDSAKDEEHPILIVRKNCSFKSLKVVFNLNTNYRSKNLNFVPWQRLSQ